MRRVALLLLAGAGSVLPATAQRLDASLLNARDTSATGSDRMDARAWLHANPPREDVRWTVEAVLMPPELPAFSQSESVSVMRQAFERTRPDLPAAEIQYRLQEFSYTSRVQALTKAGTTGAVRGLRFGWTGEGVLPVGLTFGVGAMPVAYYARAERRDGSEVALSSTDERVRGFLDHYNELRDEYDWSWPEEPRVGDLAVLPYVEAGVTKPLNPFIGLAAYYRFAPAAAAQILRNHQDFNRIYLNDAPSAVIPSAASILTAQHASLQARLHFLAFVVGVESAWSIPPLGSWTDRNVEELGASRLPIGHRLGISVGYGF